MSIHNLIPFQLSNLCNTANSFHHSQDGYVPYHSARIEMCPASSGDYSKKGKLFLEMLNEYLDQIRAPSSDHRVFMRCDVNFDITLQGRNLNTLIGRAAHIEFLETDIFAKFIMWSFPELFRWFTNKSSPEYRISDSRSCIQRHPTSNFFYVRGQVSLDLGDGVEAGVERYEQQCILVSESPIQVEATLSYVSLC